MCGIFILRCVYFVLFNSTNQVSLFACKHNVEWRTVVRPAQTELRPLLHQPKVDTPALHSILFYNREYKNVLEKWKCSRRI